MSVFIDESGDFGKLNSKSPFYYVAMVFHEQHLPISDDIECEDNEIAYTAKLSKAITDDLKKHYDYFSSFDVIVNYYDNGQHELTKILAFAFTDLFSNVEFSKVQPAEYKLFQVADLICTMELTNDKAERNMLSKSELEFFHSAHDFKKNLYKQLEKKKL